MLKTLIIPFAVGLLCFVIAAAAMEQIMPHIEMDSALKGLIKVVVWIIAFAVPSEYLRKKAKQKLAEENNNN